MYGNQVKDFLGQTAPATIIGMYMYGNQVKDFLGQTAPATIIGMYMYGNQVKDFLGQTAPATTIGMYMYGNQVKDFLGQTAPTTIIGMYMYGNQVKAEPNLMIQQAFMVETFCTHYVYTAVFQCSTRIHSMRTARIELVYIDDTCNHA